MTDPTDVLDTLDWLAADARRSPATLAALLRLNVPDPHATTDRLAADPVTNIRDAALPPLVSYPRLAEHLPAIAQLIDAGLRPSHLNTYRAAGCRKIDDVLRAVREGITPARAKALLDARGERTYDYRPLRLANMHALLRAHAEVPLPDADAAPAT